MRRVTKYIFIFLTLMFLLLINVSAKSVKTYIRLDDLLYSTNNKSYESIPEYRDLDDFLKDYKSNKLPTIYITHFLFDGVSSVKTPDLDDFIENDSNDIKIKSLKIRVININTIGNIEFSGNTIGTMIAVNTNNIKGNINLILNNVNIDTDSKKAPAIFIYNVDKNYEDCKVTIMTKKDSKNYIEGGKLKKVSLMASEDLDNYANNYSSNGSLTNYLKYSSYYGIYARDDLKNILFATVQADDEDVSKGSPYYYYKGRGVISSDIDLYFTGDGYLKITSKNGEGVETKGNLTLYGGNGEYEIFAEDDCLNTTTTSIYGMTTKNDLIINVKSIFAYVSLNAKEGDAIDSNGKIIVNGGEIYAIAHPSTPDCGLDSEEGIYINGGTIISTGAMLDYVSDDSKQKFIYASFDELSANSLVVIKDQDNNIITAFRIDRTMNNILYSKPDLNYETYKIFIGGTIEGQEENGLYRTIDSYIDGEEIEYKNIEGVKIEETETKNNTDISEDKESSIYSNKTKIVLIAVIALFVFIFVYTRNYKLNR